jgi:hypothetical protein
LALTAHQPQQAIDILRVALPVELGISIIAQTSPCLWPVYTRAETYLTASHATAAAAEFQELIDHRGITWNCTVGALAHLGVARPYVLESRTLHGAEVDDARVKARATYNDFLTP